MQVILQKDVKNLGEAGQTVQVKNGYARHFLFPKKWAVPFTKAGAAEQAHRQQWIKVQQKKAQILRQSLLEKLQNVKVSFQKEADSNGKLFGSVTPGDLIKALEKQGLSADKKWIQLNRPLKTIGEHKVLIQLNPKSAKAEIEVCISPAPVQHSHPADEEPPAQTKQAKPSQTAKDSETKAAKKSTESKTASKKPAEPKPAEPAEEPKLKSKPKSK